MPELCLVSRAFSSKTGGLGVYAKLLLEGLKNKGFKIEKIVSSERKYSSLGYFQFISSPSRLF